MKNNDLTINDIRLGTDVVRLIIDGAEIVETIFGKKKVAMLVMAKKEKQFVIDGEDYRFAVCMNNRDNEMYVAFFLRYIAKKEAIGKMWEKWIEREG